MLLASALTLKAQDLTGDWYGALKVSGATLNLVFHISKSGDIYSTTMDSPDQGAKGMGTDKTTFNNNVITVEAAPYGIKYTATYKPDSALINGTFAQGGLSLPLTLTRKQADKQGSIKRPQDPTAFPYKQEEVTFPNAKAGNLLAGTLTMPAGGNVSKIVVLISGSGPQNRNEELQGMNHRPFLVWSDWLTRNGVAVLRYDDRGFGKSTGKYATATMADFADDAEAAVKYIQGRPDLNKLAIGLIGHSEGGMVAPMVAGRNNAVKFICLLAGPGIPVPELLEQQKKDQLRLAGVPEEAMQSPLALNRKIIKVILDNQNLSTPDIKAVVDTAIVRELRAYPAATFAKQSKQVMAGNMSAPLLTPWYRHALLFKPADYLVNVKCPVLALNGTLDSQVESTANLAGIKTALQKGGNKNHQEVALMGFNHLFQRAKTGSVNEYAEINETVDPIVLEKVSTWIRQLK